MTDETREKMTRTLAVLSEGIEQRDQEIATLRRRIENAGAVLSDYGCNCDCDCGVDEAHDLECDVCLACQVSAALEGRPSP